VIIKRNKKIYEVYLERDLIETFTEFDKAREFIGIDAPLINGNMTLEGEYVENYSDGRQSDRFYDNINK